MDSTIYAKQIPSRHDAGECAPVPEFRRNQFVYGQLMGVADFRAEQSYFREKLRLINRCMHGYGVVCGLLVRPVNDPRDCAPEGGPTKAEQEELKQELDALEQKRKVFVDKGTPVPPDLLTAIDDVKKKLAQLQDRSCAEAPPVRIVIDCGIALDCQGNELVVRRPLTVDLWRELSADDRKRIGDDDKPQPVYLTLCYCEQPVDPIRPVLADQCGAVAECAYGKVRESVRVAVSLTPPEEDHRCETCCSACGECCLLLARIDNFKPGTIEPVAIHNEVRRRLTTYQSVVITNVNWAHGGQYDRDIANKVFGFDDDAGGIEIHFSRPVRVSSFTRGVVELWRIDGGGGRAGNISEIPGRFVDLPKSGTVTTIRYRPGDAGDEQDDENRDRLDYEDRVLITVRCAFILDECCRPVDGANVGGNVPPLEGATLPHDFVAPTECAVPPWGYGPWTSGNGTPGSTFDSWIMIAAKKKPPSELIK